MDEEAFLIIVINDKDEDGFPVEHTSEIPVYVREKSVTRTEFYEAYRSGVNVRAILEMRQEDWEQSGHMVNGKKAYATRILYDGSIYEVVRAYKTDRAMIQITCA